MNEKRVDISPFLSSRQEINVGFDPKFWVEIDGEKYLYKYYYPEKYATKFNEFKTFNEVLVSRIGKKLGMDCVDVEFARNQQNLTKGCLVKSFLKNGDESMSMTDLAQYYYERKDTSVDLNNAFFAWRAIKFFCEEEGLTLDENVLENLKKIAILDYFVGQNDRNFFNIELLINKKGDQTHVRLAPMFDNGRCFGSRDFQTVKENPDRATNYFLLNKSFLSPDPKSLFSYAKGIAYELKKDDEFLDFYKKIMEIDINKEIDDLVGESGVELDDRMRRFICSTWNESIRMVNDAVKFFEDQETFEEVYYSVEPKFREDLATDLGYVYRDAYLNYRCYKTEDPDMSYEEYEFPYCRFLSELEAWKDCVVDEMPDISDFGPFLDIKYPAKLRQEISEQIEKERAQRRLELEHDKTQVLMKEHPELFDSSPDHQKILKLFERMNAEWIYAGDEGCKKPKIDDAIAKFLKTKKTIRDTDDGR